jgi:hypothetical protein
MLSNELNAFARFGQRLSNDLTLNILILYDELHIFTLRSDFNLTWVRGFIHFA